MASLLAHIVRNSEEPAWAQWAAAAALFGGGLGAVLAERSVRRVFAGVAALGLMATMAAWLAAPPLAAADVVLVVVSPSQESLQSSLVDVVVCGYSHSGALRTIPMSGDLLSLTMDQRQTVEFTTSERVVETTVGTHTLTAELLTSGHREFLPPVRTHTSFRVTQNGAPTSARACPSHWP